MKCPGVDFLKAKSWAQSHFTLCAELLSPMLKFLTTFSSEKVKLLQGANFQEDDYGLV